jgi:hypothetical protein
MQPAFWWFASTVFAIIALYFYWTRKSTRSRAVSARPESTESPIARS